MTDKNSQEVTDPDFIFRNFMLRFDGKIARYKDKAWPLRHWLHSRQERPVRSELKGENHVGDDENESCEANDAQQHWIKGEAGDRVYDPTEFGSEGDERLGQGIKRE
jgi:hypothetical protein